MKENLIETIRQHLLDETGGNKFSKLKEALIKKYSITDRIQVLEILIEYTKSGNLLHWRNFLLTDIIALVQEQEYIDYFEWTITVPELTYWGIDGMLKTNGNRSYEKLIELVLSHTQPIAIRAKAIKSISLSSKNIFDRGLPADPGYWKPEDLRIAEVQDWQKNDYPDGQGYAAPKTHPSLANPKTELEKIVAALNKTLETKRSKNQDLSNPKNWLVIADETDILSIEMKWTLPENYLSFLKLYSPLNVFIDSKKFFQGLHLYGASTLIQAQAGYSFDPVAHTAIAEWPGNFVVIADAGADPFCIDISNINNNDAPIYTSMHGTGEWEFELYADSFQDFLKELTVK